MLEVIFRKENLKEGIDYEWATRKTGDRTDLVAHFFLGENGPNIEFFNAMQVGVKKNASHDSIVETSYTEEFDGHDLVISNVEGFKAAAIMSSIAKTIKEELDG